MKVVYPVVSKVRKLRIILKRFEHLSVLCRHEVAYGFLNMREYCVCAFKLLPKQLNRFSFKQVDPLGKSHPGVATKQLHRLGHIDNRRLTLGLVNQLFEVFLGCHPFDLILRLLVHVEQVFILEAIIPQSHSKLLVLVFIPLGPGPNRS